MKLVHASLAAALAASIGALPQTARAGVGTWDVLSFEGVFINDLAFEPGSATDLYLAPDSGSPDTVGVWKSLDGGHTWSRVLDSGGVKINGLAVDPTNPSYVWAARDQASVSASSNAGGQWQTIGGFGPANKVFDISIPEGNDPINGPYRIVFGTLFGTYSSIDGGTTLNQISNLTANVVRVCPNDPDIIWVGTSVDGPIFTTDGGNTWRTWDPDSVFEGRGRVRNLEIQHDNCLAALVRVWDTNSQDRIFYTTDGGDSWDLVSKTSGKGLLLEGDVMGIPSTTGPGLDYSTTGGAGFDYFGDGLENGQIINLVSNPGVNGQLVAGTESGVAVIDIDLHPGPPTDVSAECGVPFPDMGIKVSWTAPTENADGSPMSDLAGYLVMRDVPPFGTVDDTLAQLGLDTTYYDTELDGVVAAAYVVAAVDSVGLVGTPSEFSSQVIPSLCDTTGISGDTPASPSPVRTELRQNNPNPFNPRTAIEFVIGETEAGEHVELSIYDARGELVKKLVDGIASVGTHRVVWDGTDSRSQTVASGVYFYRLDVGTVRQLRSMVVLK